MPPFQVQGEVSVDTSSADRMVAGFEQRLDQAMGRITMLERSLQRISRTYDIRVNVTGNAEATARRLEQTFGRSMTSPGGGFAGGAAGGGGGRRGPPPTAAGGGWGDYDDKYGQGGSGDSDRRRAQRSEGYSRDPRFMGRNTVGGFAGGTGPGTAASGFRSAFDRGGAGGGGAASGKGIPPSGGGGGGGGSSGGGSGGGLGFGGGSFLSGAVGLATLYGAFRLVSNIIDMGKEAIQTSDQMRRQRISLETIYRASPGTSAGAPAGTALFGSLMQTAVQTAGVMTRPQVYQTGEALALSGATPEFAGRATNAAGTLSLLRGQSASSQFTTAVGQVMDTEELTQRQLRMLRVATGLNVEHVIGDEMGISAQEVTARSKTGQLLPFTSIIAIIREVERMQSDVEGMARGSMPLLAARTQEAFDQKVTARFGDSINREVAPGLGRILDAANANGGAFERWGAAAENLAGWLGRIAATPLPFLESVLGPPGSSGVVQNRLYRDARGASTEAVDRDSVERATAIRIAGGGYLAPGTPSQITGTTPGSLDPAAKIAGMTEAEKAKAMTPGVRGFFEAVIPGLGPVLSAAEGIGSSIMQGIAPTKAHASELESAQNEAWTPGTDTQLRQSLKDKNLEKYIADACAPIVEAGIMRSFGQSADEGTLLQTAIQTGAFQNGEWQGPGRMVSELQDRGIASTQTQSREEALAAIRAGRPVGISTPGHWALATGADENGNMMLGRTGEAFKGGSSIMDIDAVERLGGGKATFVIPTAAGSTGNPATDKAARLQAIAQRASAAGLDQGGVRAALAVADSEGGLFGAIGDGGTSGGDFQLHEGGQLDNWAASQGMTNQQALARLKEHPEAADEWALRGYLGNSIKQGEGEGLSGPALAYHASAVGQGSARPDRAAASSVVIQNMEISGIITTDEKSLRAAGNALAGHVAQGMANGVGEVAQNTAVSTGP